MRAVAEHPPEALVRPGEARLRVRAAVGAGPAPPKYNVQKSLATVRALSRNVLPAAHEAAAPPAWSSGSAHAASLVYVEHGLLSESATHWSYSAAAAELVVGSVHEAHAAAVQPWYACTFAPQPVAVVLPLSAAMQPATLMRPDVPSRMMGPSCALVASVKTHFTQASLAVFCMNVSQVVGLTVESKVQSTTSCALVAVQALVWSALGAFHTGAKPAMEPGAHTASGGAESFLPESFLPASSSGGGSSGSSMAASFLPESFFDVPPSDETRMLPGPPSPPASGKKPPALTVQPPAKIRPRSVKERDRTSDKERLMGMPPRGRGRMARAHETNARLAVAQAQVPGSGAAAWRAAE